MDNMERESTASASISSSKISLQLQLEKATADRLTDTTAPISISGKKKNKKKSKKHKSEKRNFQARHDEDDPNHLATERRSNQIESLSDRKRKKNRKRQATEKTLDITCADSEVFDAAIGGKAGDNHKRKKKRRKSIKQEYRISPNSFSLKDRDGDSQPDTNHHNSNSLSTQDGKGYHLSTENLEDSRPSSPLLEGSMIEDIFVLIDRKTGTIYSATERQKNGDRVQVGELGNRGQVVLKGSVESHPGRNEQESPASQIDPKCDTADPLFPFETDPDDHCESPLEAFEDILPILQCYSRRIHPAILQSSSQQQLSIYDPYYCNGRVASHLDSLGFPNVYNCKEDCYQVWKDSTRYPHFDILMTNPPYSGNHVQKLMEHVTSKSFGSKGWMILMPTFVHKKDYFQKLTTTSDRQPIFLVPRKRYIYQPPANFRCKKASDTHKKSSPFISMWYLWGGSRHVTDEWYRLLQEFSQAKSKSGEPSFDMARSKSALRDLRRKPNGKKR